MGEQLDASKGWCCDGRTHHEHASEDGHCCQPEGQSIEDLPEDGQEKARKRLQEADSASRARPRTARSL